MTKQIRMFIINAMAVSGTFIVNACAAGGDVASQGENLLQTIFDVYKTFLLPIFLFGAVICVAVFAFTFLFTASDSEKSADQKISEAKDRMKKVLIATAFATLIPAFVLLGRELVTSNSLQPWDPSGTGNHIITPAGGNNGSTLFEGGENHVSGGDSD